VINAREATVRIDRYDSPLGRKEGSHSRGRDGVVKDSTREFFGRKIKLPREEIPISISENGTTVPIAQQRAVKKYLSSKIDALI